MTRHFTSDNNLQVYLLENELPIKHISWYARVDERSIEGELEVSQDKDISSFLCPPYTVRLADTEEQFYMDVQVEGVQPANYLDRIRFWSPYRPLWRHIP